MPRMDGLTFLRKLMRQHPMPVILCTDHPERGLTGLELGAIEVIAKPDWNDRRRDGRLGGEALRDSLRRRPLANQAPTSLAPPGSPRHNADVIVPTAPYVARAATAGRVIVIGASTGGVQAIARPARDLPPDLPGHRDRPAHAGRVHGGIRRAAESRPDDRDGGRRGPARRADPARRGPGHPRARSMAWSDARVGYRIELVDGPPVSRHRPSVDVLFRSTAQAAGPKAAAVILTGMGDDGAEGLLEVREAGGLDDRPGRGHLRRLRDAPRGDPPRRRPPGPPARSDLQFSPSIDRMVCMRNVTVQTIKTKYTSLEPVLDERAAASGLPPKPEPSAGVESLTSPRPPDSLGSPSKPV